MAESPYSRRLHWQRLRNGKTTIEAARMLGAARETVSRIEHGHQGRRANVFKVQRAAEVFGVPDYYFTAETVQEYMQRYIRDNATTLAAQFPQPCQRLAWVVRHLTEHFPPVDFTTEGLRQVLGPDQEMLDLCLSGQLIPPASFLDKFFAATGASALFIAGKPCAPISDASYEHVVDEARRRRLSPADILWAINTVFGPEDSDTGD